MGILTRISTALKEIIFSIMILRELHLREIGEISVKFLLYFIRNDYRSVVPYSRA